MSSNSETLQNTPHVEDVKLKCSDFRFEKFILYETSSFYYLVASNSAEEMFRMIKIDRDVEKPNSLSDILVRCTILCNSFVKNIKKNMYIIFILVVSLKTKATIQNLR